MSSNQGWSADGYFRQGAQAVGEALATGMLQVKSVELRPSEPFTWSSGWLSPMYCDNRVLLGHPLLREHIVREFTSILETNFPGVDSISGAATGGIAHAAFIADRQKLPMSYVRGSAKGHGRQKRVEGYTVPGSRTVVIEDTLSTGASAYDAAAALQDEGLEVLGVLSIFSYDFQAAMDRAVEAAIPAYRLVTFETLIQTACRNGYISAADVNLLNQWRETPDQYQPS